MLILCLPFEEFYDVLTNSVFTSCSIQLLEQLKECGAEFIFLTSNVAAAEKSIRHSFISSDFSCTFVPYSSLESHLRSALKPQSTTYPSGSAFFQQEKSDEKAPELVQRTVKFLPTDMTEALQLILSYRKKQKATKSDNENDIVIVVSNEERVIHNVPPTFQASILNENGRVDLKNLDLVKLLQAFSTEQRKLTSAEISEYKNKLKSVDKQTQVDQNIALLKYEAYLFQQESKILDEICEFLTRMAADPKKQPDKNTIIEEFKKYFEGVLEELLAARAAHDYVFVKENESYRLVKLTDQPDELQLELERYKKEMTDRILGYYLNILIDQFDKHPNDLTEVRTDFVYRNALVAIELDMFANKYDTYLSTIMNIIANLTKATESLELAEAQLVQRSEFPPQLNNSGLPMTSLS